MTTSYCIIWRTGGTENFKWNRTASMTREYANAKLAEMHTMGFAEAFIDKYESSIAIGLPETFDSKTSLNN